MNLNDYQMLSSRTANRHENEILNYELGITGEAGEVADLIKKMQFHGHDIDLQEFKKELGDVLWYLSQIARIAGLSLEEIAIANIDKLKNRYPNGFDSDRSVNRED
ncbi:nucleoside triphosphate pyrophosphohydrolase family protein [Bacillus sp. Marseille-P3800]|uniref:nucleoside triphosphate pyrophosphohydrolase family protein n=1 Tax=Bacillus sp. Marseille-P3800 TaxID=2014782 RepID=UPI000C06CB5B|nr:nucleoside triphosphate pyrophosphohydrolase family protein [Bacillus sp. Marseille-P3800]